jgi:hypothetical protein
MVYVSEGFVRWDLPESRTKSLDSGDGNLHCGREMHQHKGGNGRKEIEGQEKEKSKEERGEEEERKRKEGKGEGKWERMQEKRGLCIVQCNTTITCWPSLASLVFPNSLSSSFSLSPSSHLHNVVVQPADRCKNLDFPPSSLATATALS